jgi:hypothetical protein
MLCGPTLLLDMLKNLLIDKRDTLKTFDLAYFWLLKNILNTMAVML